MYYIDKSERNFLKYLLIGTCVVTNTLSFFCFLLEVFIHPSSFYLVSLLFTGGMFVVPRFTAEMRHNKDKNTKNIYDILFVLYGAITHSICSLSVGLAGDKPWGCSITQPFDCDMNHPGVWGAFFFAIASITGHAFGWEKIAIQRMTKVWIGVDDFDKTNKMHEEKLKQFSKHVEDSYIWSLLSFLILLIFSVVEIINNNWEMSLLYIAALFFVGFFKPIKLFLDVGKGEKFSSYRKNMFFSVINITLIVWAVGLNWFKLGKNIQLKKNISIEVVKTLSITLVAFIQHFHI